MEAKYYNVENDNCVYKVTQEKILKVRFTRNFEGIENLRAYFFYFDTDECVTITRESFERLYRAVQNRLKL